MSTEVLAYLAVFGLFGAAFLAIAVSQILMLRALTQLRANYSAKWEELGSPTIFGRDRESVKDALLWMRSTEATALVGDRFVRPVRVAWVLQYIGGILVVTWLGLWAWAVL